MRRLAAALLIFAAANCRPERPDALYEQGRAALQRGDSKTAEGIARKGEERFAAQPYWRELFGLLEAESAFRTGSASVPAILGRTPPSGAPLPAVRRLMTRALAEKGKENELYAQADALAARTAPQLRPEIAMRRIRFAQRAEAMQFARQAIDGGKALQQTWVVAGAYGLLGNVESDHERWSEAIEDFEHSLQYARAAHLASLETTSMTNLGWAYMETGDFEQALPHLQQALKLAEQQSDAFHKHMALTHIADIYERRIELGNALLYAKQALATAQRVGPKQLANSYHQLAQIELELGHYDSAEQLNANARKARRDAREDELWERFIEARLLAANGNPATALHLLEELLASCYGKPDDPTRWRAQGIAAGIYGRLGHFSEAEQWYEATLATGAVARERVKDVSSLAFDRNLLGFYDGYIDLLLNEDRRSDALLVAERSRARVLRERIGYSSDADIDPVELARRKNATILCYWLGEKRSLLWSVTPKGIEVARLDADDVIDRAADEYRRELEIPRRWPLNSALGASLYTKLVAPAKIATRRVIILPDSHLNALAFEALIVPAPERHYWIEDVTVSYSPSLRLLAQTTAWKAPHDACLLVFGAVPAAGAEFPKLERASEEIDVIARHFDPSRRQIVRGADATPASYVRANPARFQFIHFAAHGTANARTPLDSSVILARDEHGFQLSGHEIVKNRLAAELVTISSCNSAGRRSYAGEGLVGLAWAFLGAGAHRVVAAQWAVSDSAAPRVMDRMYAEIAKGAEPAEALRTAKLALLHSDGPEHRPAYWAPFVVYEAM